MSITILSSDEVIHNPSKTCLSSPAPSPPTAAVLHCGPCTSTTTPLTPLWLISTMILTSLTDPYLSNSSLCSPLPPISHSNPVMFHLQDVKWKALHPSDPDIYSFPLHYHLYYNDTPAMSQDTLSFSQITTSTSMAHDEGKLYG